MTFNKSKFSILLAISFLLNSVSIMADSDSNAEIDKHNKNIVVKGKPATGPNRILDGPLRNYGLIFGFPLYDLNYSELGVHNPFGTEPLPLTKESPDSAILSTFVDPDFVAFFGIDPESIDQASINVPLQEVKTLVSGDNVTRETLPPIHQSEPFSRSIASPNKQITKGDWLKASGTGIFKCTSDGMGSVTLRMKHLVPNRLYTVWGAVVRENNFPINQPLGGAPSAFTTNGDGNALFKRELNFCPLEFNEQVRAQLAWVMVVLHTDHMAYGGVFSPDLVGLFGGTVAHVHMEFHLLGEDAQ